MLSHTIYFITGLLGGYLINITYITVFYHRALAHKAVELTPSLRRWVIRTGIWFTGLDPKGWVCMHRLHHLYSDTALDPHSPRNVGVIGVATAQLRSYEKALRGLINNRSEYTTVVADLDFPVNALNRRKLWALPYLTYAALFAALGFVSGLWPLCIGCYLGLMSHPVQGWMVNAFGHAHGYRNFETKDDSRNNTAVAWLVMGEGYQNNHHYDPASAKFSRLRWEVDLGYGLCLILRGLGVVNFNSTGGKYAMRQR
jgi:stearoyl-CoA desaturase (delta-9 desaturase)